MDDATLEGFVVTLRSTPLLKLAIKTASNAKGLGPLADILLDESVSPTDISTFFHIIKLAPEDRQSAVDKWMEEHKELAERIRNV